MEWLDLRRQCENKLNKMCVLVKRENWHIFIWEKFVQHVLPGNMYASAVLVQGRALAAVISAEFLFMLKTLGKN